MKRTIQLSPVASLEPLSGGGELVAFGPGPDDVVYLAFALQPIDYRTEQPNGPSFAKTIPAHPQDYRVIGLFGGDVVLDVRIKGEPFNIHFVQPLAGELLLACSRSRYKNSADFDKNGRVYSLDGKFDRELLLGDGIQSIQTTPSGVIWTSFFDEGVFGNFGWRQPVGAFGLVAWDTNGSKLYEFTPAAGLDTICDCYALNVASENDVWLYYYTQFPLVHLRNRHVHAWWQMPVGGSDAFAVGRGHALFRGGYKDRDDYRLIALGEAGKAELVDTIELRNEVGDRLTTEWVCGRGESLYLLRGEKLYRVDIANVLESPAAWHRR